MDSPFPPACRARFAPEALLARGGFGSVYRATQIELCRPVAVKLLLPDVLQDADQVERFSSEARVTAALRHPSIVTVIDHGIDDGVPWIVYELVDGPTLRARLTEGRFPLKEAIEAAAQVCAALEEAHAHGVFHRDIKPENVLIAGPDLYKVADFGVAKWIGASSISTKSGVILGTPAYISPELIQGDSASAASDLYAVGVLLFELVTGRTPFHDENVWQLLERHVQSAPDAPSRLRAEVPAALDGLVLKALAKRPSDRFPDAASMGLALRRISLPVDRVPQPRTIRTKRARPVRPAGAGHPLRRTLVVLAAAASAALSVAYGLLRPTPPDLRVEPGLASTPSARHPDVVASGPAPPPTGDDPVRWADWTRSQLSVAAQLAASGGTESAARLQAKTWSAIAASDLPAEKIMLGRPDAWAVIHVFPERVILADAELDGRTQGFHAWRRQMSIRDPVMWLNFGTPEMQRREHFLSLPVAERKQPLRRIDLAIQDALFAWRSRLIGRSPLDVLFKWARATGQILKMRAQVASDQECRPEEDELLSLIAKDAASWVKPYVASFPVGARHRWDLSRLIKEAVNKFSMGADPDRRLLSSPELEVWLLLRIDLLEHLVRDEAWPQASDLAALCRRHLSAGNPGLRDLHRRLADVEEKLQKSAANPRGPFRTPKRSRGGFSER